jgi:hypothetical protein
MTKRAVLERLCILARKVGEEEYNSLEPYDCFCGEKIHPDYQFSTQILEFIEEAVNTKLTTPKQNP